MIFFSSKKDFNFKIPVIVLDFIEWWTTFKIASNLENSILRVLITNVLQKMSFKNREYIFLQALYSSRDKTTNLIIDFPFTWSILVVGTYSKKSHTCKAL